MTAIPVKRSKSKERHRLVAESFTAWLELHPFATHAQKVKKFNFLADSAKVNDQP